MKDQYKALTAFSALFAIFLVFSFLFYEERVRQESVSNVYNDPEGFLGEEVNVSGRLVHITGPYYGLSDGNQTIRVSNWAPTQDEELAESVRGKAPLMSDYVGKNFTMKGVVKKEGEYYVFDVLIARIYECKTSEGCVPAQCCHPTTCTSVTNAPNCEGVACTMECRPGTMDCGQGSCACEEGVCVAKIEEESGVS